MSGLNKVQGKETDTSPPSCSIGVDSKDADFPAAINLEVPLLQFHVSKVRTSPAEKGNPVSLSGAQESSM